MKTKLCAKLWKMLLVFVIAAMVCGVSACGNAGSTGQGTSAPSQSAGTESSAEKESGPDGADARTEGAEADAPAGEPGEPKPAMGIEQYKEMAGKFAFYCDSVYFDYQGDRGTVTILDIRVDEDTESQCRITVYYQEPELTGDNSYVAPTDGYMTFVIDKATMQGQMECWDFLGVPGEYLDEPVDQMAEAMYYSGFVYSMDDVYDFATGTILTASGEVLADVNGYQS